MGKRTHTNFPTKSQLQLRQDVATLESEVVKAGLIIGPHLREWTIRDVVKGIPYHVMRAFLNKHIYKEATNG